MERTLTEFDVIVDVFLPLDLGLLRRVNETNQGTKVESHLGIALCRDHKLPELENRRYSLKRISDEPFLEAALNTPRLLEPETVVAALRFVELIQPQVW